MHAHEQVFQSHFRVAMHNFSMQMHLQLTGSKSGVAPEQSRETLKQSIGKISSSALEVNVSVFSKESNTASTGVNYLVALQTTKRDASNNTKTFVIQAFFILL